MSNIKRNFASFQTEQKGLRPASSVTKKIKSPNESNIKVYTRFRPCPTENYTDTYQLNLIENSITINKSEEIIAKNGGIKKFFFTEIFDPETTQEEVMKQTCIPLIEDLFNLNKSGLLFTYGVTNAGKTHTIIGAKDNPGILPRAIHLFLNAKQMIMENIDNPNQTINIDGMLELNLEKISTIQNHPEYKLSSVNLAVESYEIYNEDIYDLLCEPKKDKGGAYTRQKLQMKEGENRKVFIKGTTTVELTSPDQVDSILERCITNRTLADTMLNSTSSRSHSLFKIILKLTYSSSANKCVIDSSLCIVDLAGSERAKRTENTGNQMVEACNINKSLLVLGRCLKALKDSQASNGSNIVVPYRDSKLTRILYEYFHEENNLRMIANINPRQVDFEESMRVLNYAAIAKDIQPIKSKIDNVRKSLFSLSSSKESIRTDERLSVVSTEDSLFNLKEQLESAESSNVIKPEDEMTRGTVIDEKEVRIKVLEEMVLKLHERLYMRDITNRLNNVNDSFNYTMNSLVPNDETSVSKMLDSFTTPEPRNAFRRNSDLAYAHDPLLFPPSQGLHHPRKPEIKPYNVNYFIFQGNAHERSIRGLQKLFNINLPKSLTENKFFFDDQDSGATKSSPDEYNFDVFPSRVDETLFEEEERILTKKKQKSRKKNNKKKRDNRRPKSSTKTKEGPNIQDYMGGYEHLSTPDIMKLIKEEEEKENAKISPFQVKIEETGDTPVARRTRHAKNK